jgi:hypothetical protein
MELLHGFLTALLVYGAVTFGFSAEGPMWASAPTGVWADVGISPYGRETVVAADLSGHIPPSRLRYTSEQRRRGAHCAPAFGICTNNAVGDGFPVPRYG